MAIEYNRRTGRFIDVRLMKCIKKNHDNYEREFKMRTWKKPVVVEIAVGMEINCYVCAEL